MRTWLSGWIMRSWLEIWYQDGLFFHAGLLTTSPKVLASGAYADEVRQAERFWQQAGIHSVPAVVINEQRSPR